MKADQHYRNITANGWLSCPGELLGYACNLCGHTVDLPKGSGTALRQVRAGHLAKARAAIRRHILEAHPHLS